MEDEMRMRELDAFLSPKKIRSSFELEGRTYEIELTTPDLRGCKYSVWGDWGPMYTFTLDPGEDARVTYRGEEVASEKERDLPLSQVGLYSPMMLDARKRFPFFLEFVDGWRGLAFAISLDAWGQPVELDVRPFRPESEVASILAQERVSERSLGVVSYGNVSPVSPERVLESQLGGLA